LQGAGDGESRGREKLPQNQGHERALRWRKCVKVVSTEVVGDKLVKLILTFAWKKLLDKLVNLRIFPDENDKLNKSLIDISGDLMLISQFTLYADCKKGRRPSFTNACHPYMAESLYNKFVEDARALAPGEFATGRFGEEMHLDFTNWGPVTIILDSNDM